MYIFIYICLYANFYYYYEVDIEAKACVHNPRYVTLRNPNFYTSKKFQKIGRANSQFLIC